MSNLAAAKTPRDHSPWQPSNLPQAIAVACALITLNMATGCRSGQARRSLVRVTESPSGTDLDTPAQRLVGSDVAVTGKLTKRDAVPEDRRVSLASATMDEVKDDLTKVQPKAAASEPQLPKPSPKAQVRKRDLEEKSPNQYDAMMKAFEAYPPEVRREAMRRLTASMAATAKKSEHPTAVDEALSSQLDDLPSLPDADPNSNRVAQRIGSPTNNGDRVGRRKVQTSWPANDTSDNVRVAKTETVSQRRPSRETIAVENFDSPGVTLEIDNSEPLVQAPAVQAPAVRVATLPPGAFEKSPRVAATKPEQVVASEPKELPSPAAAPPSPTATPIPADASMFAVAKPSHSVLEIASTMPAESPVAQVASIEADSPIDSLATADDAALYDRLIKKLTIAPEDESETQRNARLIKLRHLLVLSGNPDAAKQKIEGMSDAEQSYLRHQLMGLWTMVDPNGHPVPRRRLTGAVKQIRQAAQHAAAGSDSLEVRSVSFCTAIEAYGQTKPFKTNRFKPGQAVILYCEVENFTAAKLDNGYETHLQGSYDIVDSDGIKVESQLLPADRQVSSNYLRDYFIAYQMGLPTSLEPGNYTLRLTIEDLNGKKYGQGEIAMTMTK